MVFIRIKPIVHLIIKEKCNYFKTESYKLHMLQKRKNWPNGWTELAKKRNFSSPKIDFARIL